ncbi:hypothetical protein N9L18_00960 [Candidatus Pacebacteria bacterium]|nr:hypothetical protein [Candidatus Paceibacterota bacterium]
MSKIIFKPKQVTKKLLDTLSERARDILISRYGLGKDSDKKTLEAIGQSYGITRERVRQIEEYSLSNIRKSDEFVKTQDVFDELKSVIEDLGGVVSEQELLDEISTNKSVQNHVHFLLVIGDYFVKQKENNHFAGRWSVDQKLTAQIEDSIKSLYEKLNDDAILPESELISSFLEHLKDVSDHYKNDEIIRRWLNMSKKISKNPLGEWGKADSPNINVKGMRDYAYLVIRRHGSPIHFREVAEQITQLFDKKAHVATTHNELIKDDRFVLVGRGLYALTDWGYMSGVVRDVITELLEKHGPMTREEIIEKVLKERYVKENTIVVNLQNPKFFKRDSKGRYSAS